MAKLHVYYYSGGTPNRPVEGYTVEDGVQYALDTNERNGTDFIISQSGTFGDIFNPIWDEDLGKWVSSGLADFNNPNHMWITRQGYYADPKKAWINKNDPSKICDQDTAKTTTIAYLLGIVNSATAAPTGDRLVYIQVNWIPQTYTLSINLNGGSCSKNWSSSFNFKGSEDYLLFSTADPNNGYTSPASDTGVRSGNYISEPTKTGYTFSGWKRSDNNQIVNSTYAIGSLSTPMYGIPNPYTNLTATAQWTANTYTITLNNQNATTAGTQTSYLKYNTGWYSNSGATNSISSITRPTKNGYTFGGYYTSTGGNGTQIINSSGNIVSGKTTFTTSDTTLYAKWTANKIKLTLDPSGGSGGTSSIWYYYGTSTFYSNEACTTIITKITKPTRAGYTFNYYYGDGTSGGTNGEWYIGYYDTDFASDLATDIYKDATLYAQWVLSAYVKIYDETDNEWKNAIPYVYNETNDEWKQLIPYVYKNSTDGWKICGP